MLQLQHEEKYPQPRPSSAPTLASRLKGPSLRPLGCCLITGGTGLLGSHLVRQLAELPVSLVSQIHLVDLKPPGPNCSFLRPLLNANPSPAGLPSVHDSKTIQVSGRKGPWQRAGKAVLHGLFGLLWAVVKPVLFGLMLLILITRLFHDPNVGKLFDLDYESENTQELLAHTGELLMVTSTNLSKSTLHPNDPGHLHHAHLRHIRCLRRRVWPWVQN